MHWSNEWPSGDFDRSCPYNIKAAAIKEAMKEHDRILWLDCSFWALKHPSTLFDRISDRGYFVSMSGYNAAQVCSDASLEYFGITRDEAEKIPDTATGCFGLDLNHPMGWAIAEGFIDAALDGVFAGSREHGGQSQDPRFLFHRQDQSVATLIMGKLGLPLDLPNTFTATYRKGLPETVVFTYRG